jgi:hypothetical protein
MASSQRRKAHLHAVEEWNCEDIDDQDERLRYDFLALDDQKRLVIVEIKRSGHPVTLEELQRLEQYMQRLTKSENKDISMVLVYGGTIDINESSLKSWQQRDNAALLPWSELHTRNRAYYEHYRAVLERDVANPMFTRKGDEVRHSRDILDGGTVHRDSISRKAGLGVQDVDLALPKPAIPIVSAPKVPDDKNRS